jgi:hypothetical protein
VAAQLTASQEGLSSLRVMISKDMEGSNCELFQGSILHAPRGTEVNHEHLRIVCIRLSQPSWSSVVVMARGNSSPQFCSVLIKYLSTEHEQGNAKESCRKVAKFRGIYLWRLTQSTLQGW